jgi:hypothetical protein
VTDRDLIDLVAKNRIERIRDEVGCHFPGAEAHYSVDPEGRGVITIQLEDRLIGVEYIETPETWNRPERMMEYRKVIGNKARLVVCAPETCARSARMRMLELNNWWLFYYLVFSYDAAGNLFRVGRPYLVRHEPGYA